MPKVYKVKRGHQTNRQFPKNENLKLFRKELIHNVNFFVHEETLETTEYFSEYEHCLQTCLPP